MIYKRIPKFLAGLLILSLLLSSAPILQASGPVALAQEPEPNLPTAVAQTPPLEHPFQDEILYFLIPDRFWDGDPSNNCGDYTGDCIAGDVEENVIQHGYYPANQHYYHGGDLRGVIEKLDYIEDMGVTGIWVGPIFENVPTGPNSGNLFGHGAGYHGYWVTDFMNVDPHLGTNQDFKDLIDEAHARGIKVYMDIITNHTADIIQYLEGSNAYRSKEDFPYLDASGQPFDDRDYAYYGQDNYIFPTMTITSFPYTPVITDSLQDARNPDWLNDPLNYHNRGDSTFAGESATYGDFVGLDDLFTEKREVVEGMIEIYRYWIEEFGPDGFRIDTTRHVNMEFWQAFGPAILEAAEAEGIDHFFAFGEVFQFDPYFLSEFSTRGQLQATIDFPFQSAAYEYVVQNGSAANLRDFFAQDDLYIDADSSPTIQPTFLGNHDMGRIGFFLQSNNPGLSDEELLQRDQLAHALMFFARGTPVIYYGDEQGFTGDGGDAAARQDMFPSQTPEYNDDDLIGTDATPADDNFDPEHPLYKTIQTYAQIYKEHEGLRRGVQIDRYSTDGPGVYAFSRFDNEEQMEYVVAFNNLTATQTITVSTYYTANQAFDLVYDSTQGFIQPEPVPGDIIAPLIYAPPNNRDTATVAALAPAQEGDLQTGPDGALTIEVPGMGFAIYKAAGAIPDALEGQDLSITITNLANNDVVDLTVGEFDGHTVAQRLQIQAEVNTDTYTEVTFDIRPSDMPTATFTTVGTDANPPYQAYFDVSRLFPDPQYPLSVTLDIMAYATDLYGHLDVAAVEDVVVNVGPPPPPTTQYDYAIVHYQRPAGDYGDHTTGDFNDFWGLHFWGDGVSKTVEWTSPKPFLGEDDYGRFAWIPLDDDDQPVGFIVHKGDVKDPDNSPDRFFTPSQTPEIWLKADDSTIYTSQAEAQGYVTIHYKRPAGDFTGWGLHLWQGSNSFTTWEAPKLPDEIDGTWATFTITQQAYPELDFSQPLNYIVHMGDTKDTPDDRSFNPWEIPSLWIQQDDPANYNHQGAIDHFAIIHYHRDDSDYGDPTSSDFNDFWGLHTWGDAADPGWTTPRKPDGQDTFGIYWIVPLNPPYATLNYIIHRGDEKDPGPDQSLDIGKWGHEVWQLSIDTAPFNPDNPYVYPILKVVGGGDLSQSRAHWLTEDTIAWSVTGAAGLDFFLYYDPEGDITLANGQVSGGQSIPLTFEGPLSGDLQTQYPHLAGLSDFRLDPADFALVPEILKGQIAIVAMNADGIVMDATQLQIAGVLDDLYFYDGDLGVTFSGGVPTLRVWAPTARSVTLHIFDDATTPVTGPHTTVNMTPSAQGVWSATGDATWTDKYYLYEVEVYVPSTGQVEHNFVTDPYSISLSMNSTRSQIVDLMNDPSIQPAGWNTLAKPPLVKPEDVVIYELHARDFSVDEQTVPDELEGTYLAFTETSSEPMQHLQDLAAAGLTHLHLLPVFDIATINEDKSTWVYPEDMFTTPVTPTSTAPAEAVTSVADQDPFNWGYDPYHYTTPEGSYATDPNGKARILEFRQMVQALNQSGLRVVMDVVYNHTNASGQAERSVLDKIVPGYYHRLDEAGQVTTSTCCQNTATENAMMEKLMIDSLVTWTEAYKIDGYRFDLMGHHMKSNMEQVRDTLLALRPDIYLYGEGWDFGEVAGNARGVNATQFNMAGTGVGTFNDRLRDAVRGGGPFDSPEWKKRNQGFISGLYYDPNPDANSVFTPEQQLNELLLSADQIMVGLAGNLADFEFESHTGVTTTGSGVDYNGSPAGYTQDPQEHIVYVEAHDNETLFDITQYKLPTGTSMEDRVRVQNLGIDFTALAQGVPFFHAGMDMLRSKSLDPNSYNSGDWFNQLYFDYSHNNWGVGLPPGQEANWAEMAPVLENPNVSPTLAHIQSAVDHFQTMLRIRKSSPLFRLETEQDVMERVFFLLTGPELADKPGLIVMALDDFNPATDLDPSHEAIIVLFNANDEQQTFTLTEAAGTPFVLHPELLASSDPVVKTAAFDGTTGTFTIPPRTTAVFVLPEP